MTGFEKVFLLLLTAPYGSSCKASFWSILIDSTSVQLTSDLPSLKRQRSYISWRRVNGIVKCCNISMAPTHCLFCWKSWVLLYLDELKEWLMKANEDTSELKKLSEKEIFVKEETENKGWQFLETRLSLLLKQYKNTDSVSLVSWKKIMLCWW